MSYMKVQFDFILLPQYTKYLNPGKTSHGTTKSPFGLKFFSKGLSRLNSIWPKSFLLVTFGLQEYFNTHIRNYQYQLWPSHISCLIIPINSFVMVKFNFHSISLGFLNPWPNKRFMEKQNSPPGCQLLE